MFSFISLKKLNFFCIQKSYITFLKCNLFYFIHQIKLINMELIIQLISWNIYPVLTFLKKNSSSQFNILIDIIVYDVPQNKERFIIVYNLLSIHFNKRIFIVTKINELSTLISINSLFLVSNWIEREIWDLFGILFLLNKDLRRILTNYGFEFHPLRKDFPLIGYFETIYDDTQKSVINKTLTGLTQEYRTFKLNFKTNY